jgi:hypothetical protein
MQLQSHMIVAIMRIERYYSSVREEVSRLSDDALALLDRQEFVGFFKACGPNYIRGIRRAQEVTTLFSFQSRSLKLAQDYAADLMSDAGGGLTKRAGDDEGHQSKIRSKSKYTSLNGSLNIIVKGYGLGLSYQEGSQTFVASTIEEFNEIMKFSFRVMTQQKDGHQIGMVYGMEVSPWVDNIVFQVASRMHDETIEIPLPRSLIPRAFLVNKTDSVTAFANSDSTRLLFRCKDLSYRVDKYGYCCEEDSLYDYSSREYNPDDPRNRICKPLRTLDQSIVKYNMASNGEFVCRLDRIVRYKLNQLFELERCISAARGFPEKYDYHILKSQHLIEYDDSVEKDFTLKELLAAIDPLNDFTLVSHLGKEIDEFTDMFYRPCLAALFGTNIGEDSDTDPSYFAAYPWHTHDECMKLSCFANNMRWDRQNGGCVPGILTGSSTAAYNDNEDSKCTYADQGGSTQECKFRQSDLQSYQKAVTGLWTKTLGTLQLDYIMTHFCLPSFTGEIVDFETRVEIGARFGEEVTDYPSMAPSTVPSMAPAPIPTQQILDTVMFQSVEQVSYCMNYAADSRPILVTTCAQEETYQQWYQDELGRIHTQWNLYCLDIGEGATAGARPYMTTCNDSNSQKWIFDSASTSSSATTGRIQNRLHDDLYLGIVDGCNGVTFNARIEAQNYSDSSTTTPSCNDQQMWELTTSIPRGTTTTEQELVGIFTLENLHNDVRLCLDDGGGIPLIVWSCHTPTPEKWQQWSQDQLGRIYTLQDVNKCIDIGTGTVVAGSEAFTSTCNNSQSQQWVIDQEGRIKNKLHNLYLGVKGSCDNSTPLTAVGTGLEAQAYQDVPCNKMQQWFAISYTE